MYQLTKEQKEFLKQAIPKYFDQDPPNYDGFFDDDYFWDSDNNLSYIFVEFFKSIGIDALDYLKSIPDYLFFRDENLYKISIPDNISRIGMYSFRDCCNLETVIMSNSVKSIDSYSFSLCDNLKDIKLSNNLKSIGSNAFNGCINLESISIPNSVTRLEPYIFSDCVLLKSIEIPKVFEDRLDLDFICIDPNKTKVEFI